MSEDSAQDLAPTMTEFDPAPPASSLSIACDDLIAAISRNDSEYGERALSLVREWVAYKLGAIDIDEYWEGEDDTFCASLRLSEALAEWLLLNTDPQRHAEKARATMVGQLRGIFAVLEDQNVSDRRATTRAKQLLQGVLGNRTTAIGQPRQNVTGADLFWTVWFFVEEVLDRLSIARGHAWDNPAFDRDHASSDDIGPVDHYRLLARATRCGSLVRVLAEKHASFTREPIRATLHGTVEFDPQVVSPSVLLKAKKLAESGQIRPDQLANVAEAIARENADNSR